ncbi:unnamed protein product, partial [Oppiella nova]
KLEKLSISFCLQVSGASLQKLTKNFRTLSINTNDMTPDLVKYGAFGQLTKLTELVFDCTSLNLSDHELVKILEGCHQLKSIFIRYEHTKDHN